MIENKWTKANKPTTVMDHEVEKLIIGDPSSSLPDRFVLQDGTDSKQLSDGDAIWRVVFHARIGLDGGASGIAFFISGEEARDPSKLRPAGTIFGDLIGNPLHLRKTCEGFSGDGIELLEMLFSKARATEVVEMMCYEALHGAGVLDDYQISREVLEWIGKDDISWMREKIGENWEALAEHQYCLHHFPASSLATMAAHIFVSRFVTYDSFTEGYLTHQFKVLYNGIEQTAQRAVDLQKNAGEAGGRSSSLRKHKNLEALMQEIEKLQRAVGLISEDRIVEQAFEAAREREQTFPKSKKTLDDYATALRSEEPFKSRYEAVFRKNA